MQDKDSSAVAVEEAPTTAQKLAARLQNLADHLLAHPHLAEVVVHRQHLQIGTVASVESLLAWADSMSDTTATVSVLGYDKDSPAEAAVYVTGTIGTLQEEVWDTVPGLLEFLQDAHLVSEAAYRVSLDLDELRRFADTVAMPS